MNEAVDAAEPPVGRGDDGRHLGFVRDIGRHDQDLGPERLERPDRFDPVPNVRARGGRSQCRVPALRLGHGGPADQDEAGPRSGIEASRR